MKRRRPLREPISGKPLHIISPLIPQSVNHYKMPRKGGGFYVTERARAFKESVAYLSKGSVKADAYYVIVQIYVGKGVKAQADPDNYLKLCGDSLVDAGIIWDDKKVNWKIEVMRDWQRPRTEIFVHPRIEQPETTKEKYLEKISEPAPPPRPCRHGALHCLNCNPGMEF
jgi:Holliday junction resolvase RusA-like endonuclease